ncbi:hypothetical protein TrLO_g3437 [Triparma laevis f. longispina]|uniref:EF-hand domain-containing protein n=1 Tax=Triparma laevis f. longispina TaxID=1714387 RepID=A0A9W7EHM0_9STRA|nr:hypothetical protein TrLO_g3437 [Triparma laevis f. longispina]
MIPLFIGLIIWGSLVILTFIKLGSQSKPSKQLPPKAVSISADPTLIKSRCYSNQILSSYEDAVSGHHGEVEDSHSSKVDFNPFVNDTKYLTLPQRLKLSIMTWTIFPIRLLISLLLLLLIISYGNLAALFLPKSAGLTTPISSFRRFLLLPFRTLLRLMLFNWGFYWIRVKGKKASAKEAPVIAPNHVTFIEPLYLMYANAPMSVGAKATMMFPGTSKIHQLLQSIPLEKYKEPNSKENVYSREWVKEAMMERTASGGAWPQLMIFPEGTTKATKALIHFKNGPFLPGKPVQPVIVKFPFRYCDLTWVTGGVSQVQLLYRMMCQFYNCLEIEYLPVYVPSEDEKGGDFASAKLFAHNVRNVMANAMGVPTTEHSYEDVRLAGVAIALHMPANDALLEIGKAKKFLAGVSMKTIEKHLTAFAAMDTNHTGQVTFNQFAEAFELKQENGEISHGALRMFDLIDTHGHGTINFKDYLFGLALVNEVPQNRKQLVKLAFHSFDPSGKGLTLPQFSQIMSFNPTLDPPTVAKIFKEADTSNDGFLTFSEFNRFVNSDHEEIIDVFKINFLDRTDILARKMNFKPEKRKTVAAGKPEEQVKGTELVVKSAESPSNMV